MNLYAPDEIEIRIITVFTIKREEWENEYGVEPGAVVQDIAEYYRASEVKGALEMVPVFGPLASKLNSVNVLIGKGPKAISTEA